MAADDKPMLNPDLNAAELAERYRVDERLRIENVLRPDVAERIRECCLRSVPFEFLCNVDGRNVAIPGPEMAQLDPARKQELQQKVQAAASRGVGFFYCGYMMTRAQSADNDDLRFLHSVFEFLNGEEMLSFIAGVSGRDDLKSADAQYTRYTPGHFLTRHRDDTASEKRRLAYVLGLSQNWHPDWGGLLQFFEDNGTPREAWLPTFNCLSLFDVRHVHSVTFVTPFALGPRLSLTGWFRART